MRDIVKVNLRKDTHARFLSFVSEVDRIFTEREQLPAQSPDIEPSLFWTLDSSGTMEFKSRTADSIEEKFPLENVSWNFYESNFPWFGKMFEDFRLQKYYPTVIRSDIAPNRHANFADGLYGCWLIVIFSNTGTLSLVEPQNFETFSEYSIDKPMFEYLDPSIETKLLDKVDVIPGDVVMFNSWQWHQLKIDSPPKTVAFCPININSNSEAEQYLNFLESF